ncbi:type II toxin-antitoxin system RelE family toxin [Silvibacterium dinghuense]|uniref:Type II toxin-antitoxin system RelE/ParE family toxin n=1 Tax=Silvibacterium dinghuense TaxID=1560006 RepID=A0A4Q1SH44_9BACT|nr:type II toxin-antitoxin system RelE/ParE family toxin [Silvibacterium dinghuense]RXS96881.1 type II toxin-antitoxin system RelE/ParE family toxin [Silvibacterium dinghuense]GGG94404.1 translation repressor RelE [Silvibacterium dinghuense]
MSWRIELSESAMKDLDRLDRQVARRILKFLETRLAPLDDPRNLGEALKGLKLGDFWKYRVGDYRILCDIQDKRILILVLAIGNRREIYR